MKTDNFEKRLQQVAPREIPPVWREEILSAARQAEISRHPSPAIRHNFFATLIAQLDLLSRRQRAAWASLGFVWAVIFALNFSAQDHSSAAQARHTAPPSPEALAAWHAQRRELAALVEPNPPREIEAPKNRPPQPRSNRRDEAVAV